MNTGDALKMLLELDENEAEREETILALTRASKGGGERCLCGINHKMEMYL